MATQVAFRPESSRQGQLNAKGNTKASARKNKKSKAQAEATDATVENEPDDIERTRSDNLVQQEADSEDDRASHQSENETDNFISSGDSDSEADPDEDISVAEKKRNEKRIRKADLYKDPEAMKEHRAETKARRDAKDQQLKARIENEGTRGYAEARKARGPPSPLPAGIQKIWQDHYWLVRQWWLKNMWRISPIQSKAIDKADEKIGKQVERILSTPKQKEAATEFYRQWPDKMERETRAIKAQNPNASRNDIDNKLRDISKRFKIELGLEALTKQELMNKYKFPAERLFNSISQLNKEFSELSKNKKPKHQKVERFLQGVIVFSEELQRDFGIAVTDIMSGEAKKRFLRFTDSSGQYQELYENLRTQIEHPTWQQNDAWEQASPAVYDLVSMVRDESMESDDRLQACLDTIKTHNMKLKESNKVNGIGIDTNCLPEGIIMEMIDQYKNGNTDGMQKEIEKLREQLAIVKPAEATLAAIDTEERPEEVLDSEISDGPGDITDSASGPAPRPASGPAPSIPKSLVESTNLLDVDINSISLSENCIKPFVYKDGMTEYGPVVAIRPSVSDNPRFHRFIINAGLNDDEDSEYFKVVKGSDLGPGAAAGMPQDKEVNFNLKQRKKDFQDLDNVKIGPCVVMPRAESYQRRTGVKERQPDTYIRVKYLKIDETEWVTRSEFYQLCGKRNWADNEYFNRLVPEYYTRQLLFEACKAQKANPKTRLPLTSEDFEAYPWLFPKGEGMEKQRDKETKKRTDKGKKKQNEESESMDINTEHESW
ncbi:unnamed protein product [Alternaria alternata]